MTASLLPYFYQTVRLAREELDRRGAEPAKVLRRCHEQLTMARRQAASLETASGGTLLEEQRAKAHEAVDRLESAAGNARLVAELEARVPQRAAAAVIAYEALSDEQRDHVSEGDVKELQSLLALYPEHRQEEFREEGKAALEAYKEYHRGTEPNLGY